MLAERTETVLATVLACPICRGELRHDSTSVTCMRCSAAFKLHGRIPVFLKEPVTIPPENHRSNPIGAEFETILREGKDFVLHIGAGVSAQRYPNCIEFERRPFRHTDVVGDAHSLPFRAGSFDRVFAFNVFEHLAEPQKAAAEILRVLKPGGSVAIHSAFLQAVHEAPHHYFNATEFGLRKWFSSFEVERCHVSGNFAPGMMLAYLMSSVINTAKEGGTALDKVMRLRNSTLGEWADLWAGTGHHPGGFEILQSLPQSAQSKIAAGFELVARKR